MSFLLFFSRTKPREKVSVKKRELQLKNQFPDAKIVKFCRKIIKEPCADLQTMLQFKGKRGFRKSDEKSSVLKKSSPKTEKIYFIITFSSKTKA